MIEYVLLSVVLILTILIIINEYLHKKERDILTSKIMSRDYNEYYLSQIELLKIKQDKPTYKTRKVPL